MKTRTLLIAAVMFLGLTAASFAQATYTVGSIPVTAVVSTGQVEQTGDVTFSQVNNGNVTVLGTITVTYPVPITVGMAASNADTSGVRVVNATGYTISATNPPTATNTLAILSVSSGATTGVGQVVIQVPAGAGPTSAFTLTGVRVAVAGTTLTSLNANISSTNNAITAGQTGVTVVNSIAAGISSITTSSSGSSGAAVGAITATTGTVTTQPILRVNEGFLNAFGDPANSTEAGIRVTLSAAPPAGVTITFPATIASKDSTGAVTADWQTINADGTTLGTDVAIASDTTSLQVLYRAVSATDPTKTERIFVTATVAVNTSVATLPLPAQTITATVTLAPIGTAFGTNNAVIATASLIPRYAASEVGPSTLLQITGTTTTLLVPFAQRVSALGYDTGFAIANTTEDPGKSATSFTSPVAQSGTITFYFFPQLPSPTATNPTNFSYTTAASSPGTGLDSTGKLVSGSTYTVLLSQLLSAAAAPADFSGYIFVVTNFTNGHALYVVSNFSTFSQGSLALVISGDRSISPEALNN